MGCLGYRNATSSATPNATAGVSGSPVSLPGVPASGYSGLSPEGVWWVTSGLASETLTVVTTATFDDATTQQVSLAWTTNGIQIPNISQTINLWKNGHYITAVSLTCSSSINSSAASVLLNFAGISIP